jgi:hypothetical protein
MIWQTRRVLDCGGKRSATPLSPGRAVFEGSYTSGAHESAVAAVALPAHLHKAGTSTMIWQTRRILDGGGKRNATPLSPGRAVFEGSYTSGAHESAVAAALFRHHFPWPSRELR